MKIIESKAVVVGSSAVGKTSLVVRCIQDLFDKSVSPTVGAAFFVHKMKIDDCQVNLQIWDTAGQERFKSMVPMYYRKASVAILVYDITQRDTFSALKHWVAELKSNVDRELLMILFGNKLDLKYRRVVTKAEASAYADYIGATYKEVSALDGSGVKDAFIEIGKLIVHLGQDRKSSYLNVYNRGILENQSAFAHSHEIPDMVEPEDSRFCSC